MTENTIEDVLGRTLITEQECQRRVEQARAEERGRIRATVALVLNSIDLDRDSRSAALQRELLPNSEERQ